MTRLGLSERDVHDLQWLAGRLREETGMIKRDCAGILDRWLLAMERCEPDATPGILAICENLHMMVTGGLSAPVEQMDELANVISSRLVHWRPSVLDSCKVYDLLVQTLATHALAEYMTWRKNG